MRIEENIPVNDPKTALQIWIFDIVILSSCSLSRNLCVTNAINADFTEYLSSNIIINSLTLIDLQ